MSHRADPEQHADTDRNVATFSRAVKSGDVARVRKLAAATPELVHEWPDESGAPSALHFAVMNRDVKMTCALMELGAESRGRYWPSAHTLASDREYDDILAVIEQEEEYRRRELSAPGATISSNTNDIQKAILQDRCDDAIRVLESDLSLIGACDNNGATPLHVAASAHNTEMVVWLLDRRAPLDLRDEAGRTPLECAAFFAGWSANDGYFYFLENARSKPARFDETVRLLHLNGAELTPRAAVAIGDEQAVRRMPMVV